MNFIFNISGMLLASIQAYKKYKDRTDLLARVFRKVILLRYTFWTIVTGSDIDPHATIGARLRLPHPNGVIIHGEAVIGDDCLIMQQVTIGTISGGAPTIGSNVYVGAGAKILGKLCIGDGARIGANSVVLCDVPDHSTAVGVPARIVRR